ncbi:MAG: methyltransferase [Candidatus Latescibacteria bacterium]|nr:methyltransferase [Candidatus Latescibacterota bacterium]
MKKSLVFAMFFMGFVAVVAQVLLIREMLVVFYGNELSIGIILANWLLLEGGGSWFLGRLADRIKRKVPGFVGLQIFICLYLPIAVYTTRVIKNLLGVTTGEGIGLLPIFYCSFLILAPLALAHGAQFAFGCRVFFELSKRAATDIGRVYILEGLGSGIGGLVFTWLLIPRLNSVEIALIVSLLGLLVALWVMASTERNQEKTTPSARFLHRGFYPIVISLFFAVIYLLFSSVAGKIHWHSVQQQWRGYNLKSYENSIYGNVAVVEKEQQLVFLSDGIPISTTPVPDIAFVEEFVHIALLSHSAPDKVLIIGGGVGGVLAEILKHPVKQLCYAELDPLVIKTVERFPTPLTTRELSDPRTEIKYVDGRLLVRTTGQRYDLILINLPVPSTLQLNRFYTMEFFRTARNILTKGGILVLRGPGSLVYMNKELRDLNLCIYETLRQVFPNIKVIPGDFNLFLASASPELCDITAAVLSHRLEKRYLDTRLLTDFHLRYKLDPRKQSWFFQCLGGGKKIRFNRDLLPSGLFYSLSYWNALFSPGITPVFELLNRLKLWMLLIPLAALAAILLGSRVGRVNFPVPVAVATTGFGGMAFNMVLILAFQSLYGYVYNIIALLTAAFMVGLSAGALLMLRIMKRNTPEKSLLRCFEMLILSFSLLLPLILIFCHAEIAHPLVFRAVPGVILILSAISGFLVGSEFPLANKMYLRGKGKVGQVAGMLYGVDLFGSWLGALAVSVALVPVLGIFQTCLLVAAFKLFSFVLVVALPSSE